MVSDVTSLANSDKLPMPSAVVIARAPAARIAADGAGGKMDACCHRATAWRVRPPPSAEVARIDRDINNK